MEDVVHLKNGGLIRGTIIEEVVGKSLKIKTRDGNVFIYTMDEIAKMSREPVMRMRHIGIQEKNPMVSCILSIVLPGVGQFYNGEPSKGIVHLGMFIGGWSFYWYNMQIVSTYGTSDQVLFLRVPRFCLFLICSERENGFIVVCMVSIFCSVFGFGQSTP